MRSHSRLLRARERGRELRDTLALRDSVKGMGRRLNRVQILKVQERQFSGWRELKQDAKILRKIGVDTRLGADRRR